MMAIVKDRILYRLLNRIISYMQIHEHWVTHSSLKIKKVCYYTVRMKGRIHYIRELFYSKHFC